MRLRASLATAAAIAFPATAAVAFPATAAVAFPAAPAVAAPAWEQVPTAGLPGGQNAYWYSMASTSPTDVWAAGHRVAPVPGATEFRTWVQHWDGASWSMVSTPDVESAPAVNFLRDIAASSTSAAWSVGSYRRSDYTSAPLVLTWDGASWRRSDIAAPSATQSFLESVDAASPADVWAVGTYRDPGSFTDRPWASHFDGTSWSVVSVPRPAFCAGEHLALDDVVTTAGRVVISGSCPVTGGSTTAFVYEWVGGAWKSKGTIADISSVGGLAISAGGGIWVGANSPGNLSVVTYRRAGPSWVASPPLNVGRATTIDGMTTNAARTKLHVVGAVTRTDNGVTPLLATYTTAGGWVASTTPIAGIARGVTASPGGSVWSAGVDYTNPAGFFARRSP